MNKNIPAISIIVPMYNVEKYVGECLDSILAQTFQDFEVIVVDDCSTDKSCEVVESYLSTFNRGGRQTSTDSLQEKFGRLCRTAKYWNEICVWRLFYVR